MGCCSSKPADFIQNNKADNDEEPPDIVFNFDPPPPKPKGWKALGRVLRIWPLFNFGRKNKSNSQDANNPGKWKSLNKSIIKVQMLRFFGVKPSAGGQSKAGKWMSKNKSMMLIRRLGFGGRKDDQVKTAKWKRINKSIIKINFWTKLLKKDESVAHKKWTKSKFKINLIGALTKDTSTSIDKPKVTFSTDKPCTIGTLMKISRFYAKAKNKTRISRKNSIFVEQNHRNEFNSKSPQKDLGTTLRVATAIARMGRKVHQMSVIPEGEVKSQFSSRRESINDELGGRQSRISISSRKSIVSPSPENLEKMDSESTNSQVHVDGTNGHGTRKPSIQTGNISKIRGSISVISGADTFKSQKPTIEIPENVPSSRSGSVMSRHSGQYSESNSRLGSENISPVEVDPEESGMSVNVAMKVCKAIKKMHPGEKSDTEVSETDASDTDVDKSDKMREIRNYEKLLEEANGLMKRAKREWKRILPIYKKAWEKTALPLCVIDLIKAVRHNPPRSVQLVFEAICVLKGIQPDISYLGLRKEHCQVDYRRVSQKMLAANFPEELLHLRDAENISLVNFVEFQERILKNPDFDRSKVTKAFPPCAVLYDWLIQVEYYAKVCLEVEKIRKLRYLAKSLKEQANTALNELKNGNQDSLVQSGCESPTNFKF